MNIIVVGNHSGPSRTWHFSQLKLTLLGTALVALIIFAILGLMSVWTLVYVHPKQNGLDSAVISRWQQQLHHQTQQVEEARANSIRQIDALTLRMGELQARLLRLDAVGERVVKEAHLGSGEFNFSKLPAVGGPELTSTEQPYNSEELNSALNRIEAQIEDRGRQLRFLEKFFVNKSLLRETFIAGRPIKKGWLSSLYGWRTDPFTGKRAWHSGVDFAGKMDSDIVAVASGVVTWASDRYGYGNLVEITHKNGLATRYGHADKILVKVGDVVKKGQVIAKMGSTGRSTGPHVHFEVLMNGHQINPEKYVLRANK